MQTLQSILLTALRHALEACGYPLALAEISPTQNPRFGDYQSNTAMVLAKQLRRKPQEIAQCITTHLNVEAWCHAPEIVGAGFINFRLHDTTLSQHAAA